MYIFTWCHKSNKIKYVAHNVTTLKNSRIYGTVFPLKALSFDEFDYQTNQNLVCF